MPAARTASAALHYRVEAAEPHAQRYRVTLTIARPAARQELSLPVWIPGSYLVREFARHLQLLRASQDGAPVALTQLDKCRWRAACAATTALVLHYEIVASDPSVRTAWLDAERGFFNATSVCLRVHGQDHGAHELQLVRPPHRGDWSAATGLPALKVDKKGFGSYHARDYGELADCPVELGAFWSARFSACGVAHRIVVAGAAPSFDGERLVRDTQRICEQAIRLWSEEASAPMDGYLFLLNAVDDGYGGLEHRNSTALIAPRRDLPRLGEARTQEGYTRLLGLISHEYFHTWNVKRLRPREFTRYDWSRENYTRLLWFFEGFTSYYDDLLLRRAGLIDDAAYLKRLGTTANQVLQTPGRRVQSVAQASFDAWTRYYRPDQNTPNTTVSYYTKGALVALCLDLSLRRDGRTTLDAVLRALWQRTGGGPMKESDLRTVLRRLSGRDWDEELDAWVHGTGELPLAELLAAHGVAAHSEPAQPAQRLGLRMKDGMRIAAVLRGGCAERAGLNAGDEWLGIEVHGQGWRLARLDDLALYAGDADSVTALVARDARLVRLPLALPGKQATGDTLRLTVQDAALAHAWLGPAPTV